MSSRLYFAYGSNLDFNQMAARCPNAEYVGIATLKDHVLKLDSAGYATVVAQPGAHVQGALWNLDRCDEAKLDGFEGVETGCYHKEDITVDFVGKHDQDDVIYGYQERSAAGVSLDALIYLSDRPPFGNATFRPGRKTSGSTARRSARSGASASSKTPSTQSPARGLARRFRGAAVGDTTDSDSGGKG